MSQTMRAGRRLPLPSTAEIKHELRMMAVVAGLRNAADPQKGVLASDLAQAHDLPLDRAQMLVDRFDLGPRVEKGRHAGLGR